MKHLFFLLIALLNCQISLSQDKKFSVEANLFRVVENDGLDEASVSENKAFFLNGVNLGYQLSDKFRPYISINYKSYDINRSYGFTAEDINKKEVEIRVGVDYVFNSNNKLQAIAGAQFFYDTKYLDGFYYSDVQPFESIISHKSRDVGGAINAGLRYQIDSNFYIFSKSRFGAGDYRIKAKNNFEATIFDPLDSGSIHQEPISSLGLAFKF